MKLNKLSALFVMALTASAIASSALASTDKETTLGNPGDFVILSDTEESSLEVFLSYTGEKFNHCGIALRHHTFTAGADELNKVLKITDRTEGPNDTELGQIENDRLVAKVLNPKQSKFGQFFTISTRSGESISKVLSNMLASRKVDVIIETLPCK